MSVSTFAIGDKFVIRIMKAHENNPDNLWVNSYELSALAAGTEADLLNAGQLLVAFEKLIHKVAIDFMRLVISTWEADSVPYDPEAFISTTLTGSGAVGEVAGTMPLNQCMSVARVAATGRVGHLFYRGVIDGADVESPAGKSVFQDRPGIQANLDEALGTSEAIDLFGPAPSGPLQIVMINAAGTQVRHVIGLSVVGISTVSQDHKWFNRTSP